MIFLSWNPCLGLCLGLGQNVRLKEIHELIGYQRRDLFQKNDPQIWS
jgi:hypothetical protein